MENEVEFVRGFASLIVLVPVLAGCIEAAPVEDVLVEAFEARYAVEARRNLPARVVTVTLEGPRPFLAADGQVRTGHVVDVDEAEATVSLSRPRDVLDQDLRPVRVRWCNGWAGGERPPRCIHDQYDWDRRMGGGPLLPRYGVATNVAIPESALVLKDGARTIVQTTHQAFQFDDNVLAPTRVFLENKSYAVRLSYRSLGALGTASPDPEPRYLHPVSTALLPGADEPFPGLNFSLVEAFDYLRSEQPRLGEYHDGCLAAFQLYASDPGRSQFGGMIGDQTIASLTLVFTDGSNVGTFRITYGKKAPLGNEEFLSSEERPDPLSEPVQCRARGTQALTIAEATELTDLGPLKGPRFRSMQWRPQEDGLHLMGQATFDGASVEFDASRGRVVSAHVRLEVDLDK